MYKLVGAVILLAVSLVSAALIMKKEKKHTDQLGGFCSLLEHIYKQIEAFNIPLPDILKNLDARTFKLCGIDVEGGIDEGFFLNQGGSFLRAKEKKLISDFYAGLGRCYRDEQLKSCKYYLDELSNILLEAEKEYPKKRKLTYTLCVCTALGIIILII